jgi:hypothetical protein
MRMFFSHRMIATDSTPRAARKQQKKELSTRLAEINARNREFWRSHSAQITDEQFVERKKSWVAE